MVRKNRLPKFPEDYQSDKAEEYDNSTWMERNQKRATLLCLEYLYNEKLSYKEANGRDSRDSKLILDLGCGTGFSTEILLKYGFRVIGIDILRDMLFKAKNKKKNFENYENLELILADINFLPIKEASIDYIISISSYNFIGYGKEYYGEKVKLLNDTAKYLYKILKDRGRSIIEFYPKDDEELKIFKNSFIMNEFEGYMVKSKPNQKSGQTFLLLKKKLKM